MTEAMPFQFTPIAYVRSPYAKRIDAPHQATVVQGTESGDAETAIIEFTADIPHAAFRDLDVPYADAFPDSLAGWIDAIDASLGQQSAPGPRRPR